MPIDVFVAGEPQSCYACGTGLTKYADSIDNGANIIGDAKSQSEREWEGTAGDRFRGRVQTMRSGADSLADQARASSKAVNALADGLTSAKAQMRQAANIAAEAGLKVTPDLCNPQTIMEPERMFGPMTMPQEVKYANQVRAYNESLAAAVTGRDLEKKAHAALAAAMQATTAVLQDAKKQILFLVAGETTGVVGTAMGQASKWRTLEAESRTTAASYRNLAQAAIDSGDPFWESSAMRPVRDFERQADDAARVVAANTKLAGGDGILSKGAKLMEWNPGELARDGSLLQKAGSKVPYVGIALTAAQTYTDAKDDTNAGEYAKDVGKNVGGFVAGTAVTELMLASAAGGPATFLAVTAGVGVAFGIGEVVDHWGPITRWMADPF